MPDQHIEGQERNVMLHILHGLKQQLDGIGLQIDAAIILLSGNAQGECQHPKDQRVDMSTMGHTRWVCKDCGHEHDELLKKEQ